MHARPVAWNTTWPSEKTETRGSGGNRVMHAENALAPADLWQLALSWSMWKPQAGWISSMLSVCGHWTTPGSWWSRKSKCNTKHGFCGRNIGMQRWRLTWRPAWLPTRWQQLRPTLRIECGLSKSRLRPTRSQLLPSLQRKSLLPRRRRSWSTSSSDRRFPWHHEAPGQILSKETACHPWRHELLQKV